MHKSALSSLTCVLLVTALFAGTSASAQQAPEQPQPSTAPATLDVRGFAPDAVIAVDGTPVATGQWSGAVAPGAHLIQVYKPNGPAYEFRVDAQPGQTIQLPPAAAAPAPLPAPAPAVAARRRFVVGPYVLGHLGFAGLTAKPDGFSYDQVYDDDTNSYREGSGIAWFTGATAGYRLARGFGIGGLLMYGRGGGEGVLRQDVRGGTSTHEGPADFLLQFVRFGPHLRFMAGGDRARFLAGTSVGGIYHFIDITHVRVVEQGGTLLEVGEETDDDNGLAPYWGFDLGAEFSPGDHLLLGIALDVTIDRTGTISGDPYGGTAQGLIGLSARVGWHDWRSGD